MNVFTIIILPLLTLLVGWLLREASQQRREISTDRRAISRSIADLLEIRHRTYALKSYLDRVTEKIKIPQEVLLFIISTLESFLPNIDSLQKRFNDSVDTVASSNALLGFQLRSKDEFPKLLNTLRQLASQDVKSVQLYPQFEKQLMDIIKPELDDFILALAKSHGWLTWWKIKKYLRKPITSQKQIDELLTKFGPIINDASQK